jgi:hypothetical protein
MAIQISGNTVINDVVTAGGSVTIANRTVYYVTSDSQTITLPASPVAGNEVVIIVGDYFGVVVSRNGTNIMGLAENMTIDLSYAPVRLIYVDATRGWVLS